MKYFKLFTVTAALCFLAAGCSGSSSTPTTATNPGGWQRAAVQKGGDNNAASLPQNQAKTMPAIAKTCATPPPAESASTSTNAEGKEYPYPKSKIYTSSQAIPQLWAEARKWAPDAKIRGGYGGGGTSYTPADPKLRAHFAQARGAEWAWDATFYSSSKKQEMFIAYIDGQAGGSIAQAVQESTFAADEKLPLSIYTNADDMIDSCVVYELAKANGFDEKANYHIYLTDNAQSGIEKYRNRKTWKLEERSRTDTDGGKETMGTVVNSYLFDAVTGELLEKVAGRTYSF